MSRRQAIIGHLQLFGKILLKQLNQTYTHIQQQHSHTHSTSTGTSSLETTAAFPTTASTTTTTTLISSSSLSHLRTHKSTADSLRQMATTAVAAVTGIVAVATAVTTAVTAAAVATLAKIEGKSSDDSKHPQQQQQDMSTYLPFIFPNTPSFVVSSRTGLRGSLAQQGGRERQGQDRLPCVSTTMGPRPSILPLTSIHQFISSITSTSLPVSVTNTADTIATSGTGTATGTLVRGQVLNFRGTSHHQGFLILLPDLDEDLILDLTPTLERIYGSPLHPTPSGEDDIDAGLTIVLFEEDEVPKKLWTLTIPRPVGSVLPRGRVRPGQEKERRRGKRREGQFRDVSGGGYGAGCSSGGGGGGGMGWEVDEQSVVVLRHWVSAVWDAYDRWDRYRERWLMIGVGDGSCNGETGYTWEAESCSSSSSSSGSRSGGGYEVMDLEDCRTEPRVSSLLKSINRLNGLVT
ncbi:hypothetical protein F5H01DRAFT_197266 [Linnemannia elongata]|nr:hypothetical protein F5H01DRAFT_197266 [Linnemannia elongata]